MPLPDRLRALIDRRALALALIGVLAVHLVSLQSGFVDFDDDAIFLRHPVLTQTDPGVVLPALFNLDRHDDFRPMRDLSHWADLLMHGHTPWLSHLHHLAMLALVVLATGAFLRRIGLDGPKLLVVLLLAYTHPVQVEVIGWISGRKDLLASIFFFGALVAFLGYLRSARPWGYAAATVALVALGMMSKGHVIVAPGVLLMLWLHERWRAPDSGGRAHRAPKSAGRGAAGKDRGRRRCGDIVEDEDAASGVADKLDGLDGLDHRWGTIARRPFAISGLIAAMFVGCIIAAPRVAGGYVVLPDAYTDSLRYSLTLGDRIQLPLRYVINLIRPTELNHIYLTGRLDDAHTALTIASAVLIVLLAAIGTRWLIRRDPRAPLLAIIAGLMLPFMHFKPGVVYMADRYLFLAMPFIALLTIDALTRAFTRLDISRRLQATLAAAALGLCALLSIGEHAAWHDPIALWSRMTHVYPESAWGYDRLGRAFYYARRYEEAGGAWLTAAAREPGASKHLNNAAVAAMALGQNDAAVGLLRRALAIDPDDAQAKGNLRKLGVAP